jgi:hypothetical protein
MSAFGTKRTSSSRSAMSAFGGKADIDQPLLIDLDTNEDRRRLASICFLREIAAPERSHYGKPH